MEETSVIAGGWLIDGTGGAVKDRPLIEIEKGRISAVRSWKDRGIFDEDIQDLTECTIIPAMVDCHAHLFMSGSRDPVVRTRQLDASFEELEPVITRHIRQHLSHGVVAVRDGGDYGAYGLRYRNESLPLYGFPFHLKSPGRAWRARGRYGRLIGRSPSGKLAEAIIEDRDMIDHVKIVNSGLNSLREFGKTTPPQFGVRQLRDAVKAAESIGLCTMIHANGDIPVSVAIDACCTSIEHGFFMGEKNLEKMAGRGIFWAPTAFTMKAYSLEKESGKIEQDISRKNLDHQIAQISRAAGLGVRMVAGTDSGSIGVHHGASMAEETGLLMKGGLSLQEAVRCATFNGALLLGLDRDIGRIMTGMCASMIAVEGGPARVVSGLRKPAAVIINGMKWEDPEDQDTL